MRKIGSFLLLALLAPLVGCAAKTDLRELGARVGAGWRDGPTVGVDASAGKHEVEVKPLFGSAGDAAEGAPGTDTDAPVARNRFSKP